MKNKTIRNQEKYNINFMANNVRSKPSIAVPCAGHIAVSSNNLLLVWSGISAQDTMTDNVKGTDINVDGQDMTHSICCPVRRCAHIAISSPQLLLVWGGHRDAYVGDRYIESETIHIYHLDHKYWTEHKTSGEIPGGTSGAASFLVAGKLYVFAGHTDEGNVNDLYCLDLKTLSWENLSTHNDEQERPSPRDKFASWCTDTKLYCFGGYGMPTDKYLNENGIFLPDTSTRWPQRGWNNQLFEYDIEAKIWTNIHCKGPLPSPRAAHAAARFGRHVYMFGGRHCSIRLNDLHCFDLDSNTWSGEIVGDSPWPCGRSWHTLTPIDDKRAFLYGGYSSESRPLDDAWMLDVTTRQWTLMLLPGVEARLWHTCCKLESNIMLVFGGCTNDILDYATPTDYSDEILEFHMQPLTLKTLCLDAVYKHRVKTEPEWHYLPKPLYDWLEDHKTIQQLKSDDQSSTVSRKTVALCAIS